MREITFVGQIESSYGRGKDKKKRARRNYLLGVGTGAAIGGGIGVRAGGNKFIRGMHKLSNKPAPTSEQINTVRKNLLNYKTGLGSKQDDVVKAAFNEMRLKGGLRNALRGAALGSAVVGGSMLYKKLKNRKTLKLAGKPIKINGKSIMYDKPE